MESGTDGIVALGTTGEASMLSNPERQRVLEITVEEAGSDLPIIAGTSSVNPSVVIEQSHQVLFAFSRLFVLRNRFVWGFQHGTREDEAGGSWIEKSSSKT